MKTNNHIINEIHECRYYKDICQKIARHDLADDLYQEFILALLTYDNLSEVYSKEWFRLFAKKIITNLYHSQTSTFSLKYRHMDKLIKYMPGVAAIWAEKPDTIEEDDMEIISFINRELDKMEWYQRELFRAVVEINSARKLAEKTKINRNSIRYTVNKVKDRIRKNPQFKEFLYR